MQEASPVNNSSISIDNVSGKDRLLGSLTTANSWEYTISTHSMYYRYFDEETGQPKEVTINDFRKNVKEMNLIFSEDEPLFDAFCDALDRGDDVIKAEYRAIGKDYKVQWFRHEGHTVVNKKGEKATVTGRRFDITAEREYSEPAFNFRNEKELMQDQLTGLFHRLKAKELIERELEENIALGDANRIATIILIDFDGFDVINETYGRMYGDVVLQTISGIIYTNFMTKDIITRISGDLFMVFCNEIEEHKASELIYELQLRLNNNVTLRDGRKVTASIGYAFSPRDGRNWYSLYASADIALKKAKERGGNCALAYDALSMPPSEHGLSMKKRSWHIGTEVKEESRKTNINKKLFDFAFDSLTKEHNINKAVYNILKEICLHYGYDRFVLLEPSISHNKIVIAVKWSIDPEDRDYPEDTEFSIHYWDNAFDVYRDVSYDMFENGRSDKFDYFREAVALNHVPVSAVHFPILDEENIKALILFECFEHHSFKQTELDTISTIAQLISSYRLSQQVKDFMEAESVINRNVMDSQKVVYFVIDDDTKEIKYLSRQARKHYPDAEYGKKYYETVIGQKISEAVSSMDYAEKGEDTIEYYDEAIDRWYTITVSKMKGVSNPRDTLICITDVSDFLKRVKSEDSLTVAETFDSFVMTASKRIKKKEDSYRILCCGIKNFSKINDKFGYVVGDEVLRYCAACIKSKLREGEILCRIKGDDFLVLLDASRQSDYEKIFEDCTLELTEYFSRNYPGIEINCFAGSYDIPPEEDYINRCIDKALKARNMALNGRETFYFRYTHDIEEKEQEESLLQDQIVRSLANGGFKVYFQPKVDITDGSIIGAEALCRLQDDEGRMISPGIFIPLAEKTGMVVDIDNYVYEQTFELMSKWMKEGKKVPLISVNVSRLHLFDDGLPEKMKALTDKYGLKPSQVELEITESVFFEDTERLIKMIKCLKEIGFPISMDDFGSGYSTLNFMKELPVDVIKIDGGFFMRNVMDTKSKVVISAIMQLTRNLDFESVSEGVETQEQVDFIKEQGGRCVQGYYYYKPMPAEDFANLLI